MTVYVCLDDRNGMLFNRRRQSRDSAVLEDIRSMLPSVLTVDPFSEKLIQSSGIPYVLAPEVLEPDAHFFLECREEGPLLSQADTLVIYRWNRHYPADVRWKTDPEAAGFSLKETVRFPGSSHETVTREVYVR